MKSANNEEMKSQQYLWLWDECCRDIGIDPRLVKAYFLPIHEPPYWFDPSYCQLGEAWWEDGHCPEVLVVVYENKDRWLGLMTLRHIIHHELTHVILQDEASEDEVSEVALIVSRRREGWSHWRRYLRSRAFERGLGPVRESWTLFQWARRHTLIGTRAKTLTFFD